MNKRSRTACRAVLTEDPPVRVGEQEKPAFTGGIFMPGKAGSGCGGKRAWEDAGETGACGAAGNTGAEESTSEMRAACPDTCQAG